jgi:hypothetical protein
MHETGAAERLDAPCDTTGEPHVEQGYQQLKVEVGSDDFERRSWPGFHHHATLCLLAYGFLQTRATPRHTYAAGYQREKETCPPFSNLGPDPPTSRHRPTLPAIRPALQLLPSSRIAIDANTVMAAARRADGKNGVADHIDCCFDRTMEPTSRLC